MLGTSSLSSNRTCSISLSAMDLLVPQASDVAQLSMHCSQSCAELLTSANESTVLLAKRFTGVGTAPDQPGTAEEREQQHSSVQLSYLFTRV